MAHLTPCDRYLRILRDSRKEYNCCSPRRRRRASSRSSPGPRAHAPYVATRNLVDPLYGRVVSFVSLAILPRFLRPRRTAPLLCSWRTRIPLRPPLLPFNLPSGTFSWGISIPASLLCYRVCNFTPAPIKRSATQSWQEMTSPFAKA